MFTYDLDLFEEDCTASDNDLPCLKRFYLEYAKRILKSCYKGAYGEALNGSTFKALKRAAAEGNKEAESLAKEMYCNGIYI